MKKKSRAKVYLHSDEEFIKAVKENCSKSSAIKALGLTPYGANYKTFKMRVADLKLDTSHFTGQGHLKGKEHNWSAKIPLKEILVKDSGRVLGPSFKKRIIESNLLENKCVACGIRNVWNGQPITLHFDHINGDPFDHRIENLRILCPNCHSQTETFGNKNRNGGKNKAPAEIKKVRTKTINKCKLCDKVCGAEATHCADCYRKNQTKLQTPYNRHKIAWPSMEELKALLQTMNYLQLGKKLGVSDNAIRKHIKKNKKQKQ